MPADKNYESVKSFVCDDRVTLYIHLRHPIDEEFRLCYQDAYRKHGGDFLAFSQMISHAQKTYRK